MSFKFSLSTFRLINFALLPLSAFVIFSTGCDTAPQTDTAATSPEPSASTPAMNSAPSSAGSATSPAPSSSPSPPVWASRSPGPPTVKLSEVNGFEGISDVAKLKLTQTPEGLKIHADADDPHIILPRLQVAGSNKWTVHVQISSPYDTAIQIFYDTTKHPQFDEAHSVRKSI
jgi:hypothetical protein